MRPYGLSKTSQIYTRTKKIKTLETLKRLTGFGKKYNLKLEIKHEAHCFAQSSKLSKMLFHGYHLIADWQANVTPKRLKPATFYLSMSGVL